MSTFIISTQNGKLGFKGFSPLPVILGLYSITNNVNYKNIIMFTGNSSIKFPNDTTVNILIVGGGGGGGSAGNNDGGGGGGGGGLGYGTLSLLAGITYNINIGIGGIGCTTLTPSSINQGGNTTFIGGTISETAYGGGYGATVYGTSANNGGSGGGGVIAASGSNGTGGGTATKGSGTLTYIGNKGANNGVWTGSRSEGGGGGGASIAPTTNLGGNGYTWPITGLTYAGGGAGGPSSGSSTTTTYITGGTGGGGNSCRIGSTTSFCSATFYGGGGAGIQNNQTGGSGYQGVLIIAY
jgi:fibronectin-binding autotransporter adhesin